LGRNQLKNMEAKYCPDAFELGFPLGSRGKDKSYYGTDR
jgi:hypothetical protein